MPQMSDQQLAGVLNNVVGVINPVLDVLAERDPLDLKEHTFHDDDHPDSRLQQARHAAAKLLDVADWPGTKGWGERSKHKRASWWVTRIGTLNTGAVAFPGVFGVWAKRLPVTPYLGFVNQAMVLVAIAREYGVTERGRQVALLASVLCGRDISAPDVDPESGAALPTDPDERKKSLFRGIWDAAKLLRAVDDEFEKRPQPMALFRMLGYIPVIGAPATYVGERFALSTAARRGQAWLESHGRASLTKGS
ncbi:hypothetical protein O4157_10015 [Gordonia amicalis]|uniref:hypothetical protein n=1 Tax=Gordonia amicalis TaxID=89053 RepID=UPI00046384CD|nr:hypothetical protein [Gordonia amicalis]MCZ4651770.1 hypothetical protein [Gordonia amicalis]